MQKLATLLVLILWSTMILTQDNRAYNPHHGLESRFITSWDHRNSIRYETPQRYLSAVNAIQWSGVTVGNIDRPVSSHVVPLIVDARDDNPAMRFKILEDYVYEYRPVSPVDPAVRRRYGIVKSFNGRDISQWEVHLPTVYINQIDADGLKVNSTEFREEATHYYIKNIDANGKASHYTEIESEKATLYEKMNGANKVLTLDPAEAIDPNPIPNEKKPQIERAEDYVVLANFRGRQGVHFFTRYSQVAGVSFARLHFNGSGDAEFFKFRDETKVNIFSIRSWIKNRNISYLELGSDIMEIDGRDSWLRVRNERDGSGIFRYVKLYDANELADNQSSRPAVSNVKTNSNGQKFIEIKHNGEVYYAPLMTAAEAGF